MPTKETTYQRLKRENQELREKLITLVAAPESEAAITIETEVMMSKGIEDAVWAGNLKVEYDNLLFKP